MPCNDETVPTLSPETTAKIREAEAEAEAEAVMAKMKAAETANEDAYRAGLVATNPDSLMGKIVRAFPPMGVDQLLERTAKARMDSTMEASLKAQPSRPRTTAVLGPFDSPEQLADAESAALKNLEGEREYKLNNRDDPSPSQPSRLAMNEPMLQFFAYKHLPPHLQPISFEFWQLAHWIAHNLPRNPERTVALRWLLLAKDSAVRAKLYKEVG